MRWLGWMLMGISAAGCSAPTGATYEWSGRATAIIAGPVVHLDVSGANLNADVIGGSAGDELCVHALDSNGAPLDAWCSAVGPAMLTVTRPLNSLPLETSALGLSLVHATGLSRRAAVGPLAQGAALRIGVEPMRVLSDYQSRHIQTSFFNANMHGTQIVKLPISLGLGVLRAYRVPRPDGYDAESDGEGDEESDP